MREINESLENEEQEEDLDFKLWKEELNKELSSFWKSLLKCYQD